MKAEFDAFALLLVPTFLLRLICRLNTMHKPTRAVVAGSFDPITLGHVWVIEQALQVFDQVFVLIASNPSKVGMFSLETRQNLIHACFPTMGFDRFSSAVLPPKSMTVHFAQKVGASHIIRGIRNTTDFEYENSLNLINKTIAPSIETFFVMPPRHLIEVSSSLVKGLVGLTGWELIAENYVPPPVLEAMIRKANPETQNFVS